MPRGSTALSAGLIPAAATRFQRDQGIDDTPRVFAADIQRKAHGATDCGHRRSRRDAVRSDDRVAGRPLRLAVLRGRTTSTIPAIRRGACTGCRRRSGAELIDRLRAAVGGRGIPILTGAPSTTLFADADGRVRGVELVRPMARASASAATPWCSPATAMAAIRRWCASTSREMADALYFGHPGNHGDAVLWGEALGAALRDMSGYQGHGSVAHPHGILITWAAIMEGGFQVNAEGRRFSDETHGYSEQAAVVLRQPGGVAFDIFDARIAGIARQFEDFRNAEAQGARAAGRHVEELAKAMKLPAEPLARTFAERSNAEADVRHRRIRPEFCGLAAARRALLRVRVTGALFHTQGGLAVDRSPASCGRTARACLISSPREAPPRRVG